MMNLGQRRAFDRNGGRGIERTVLAAAAVDAAEKSAARAETLRRNQEEKAPVPYTDDEYQAAKFVRDRWGWHQVRRVNAKSVTVETGYSTPGRIARAKVLEVWSKDPES